MEWLYQEYGPDGFFPILIMYDGTPESMMQLAEERDLTFPVLADPEMTVFDRFDPEYITPSSTFLVPGSEVHSIDVSWHNALVEEVLYGEP